MLVPTPITCATNWDGSPNRRPRTGPTTPFQPTPYVPSAKSPSESAPQVPHTPCTAKAPTGSSIRNRISTHETALTTSIPATTPMRTAAAGLTKAHGPVTATRPPRRPLQAIATSGLRRLYQTKTSAVNAPAAEASMVLTAMVATRESAPASVEPALNPNQPNASTNVPMTVIGRLCPGMALTVPSRRNL